MDIYYIQQNSYLSSTFRRDLTGAGKAAGASAEEEKPGLAAQSADQVEISEQARTLQQILAGKEAQDSKSGESNQQAPNKRQSNLMDALEGKENVGEDKRLAYGGAAKAAENGDDSGSDDLASRIRALQKQLSAALKRLQEARQELSDAQAESGASQQAADPDAVMSQAEQQELKQKRSAAQQKMASAQAEVTAIQEQLQKLLQKQAQAAQEAQGSASPAVSIGQNWQPQGTNDYISGDW